MKPLIDLFLQTDFLTNFFANLLSTIIGIILGIPIAFAIDRHMQKISQKEQNILENENRNQLTITLLNAISHELDNNTRTLRKVQEELPNNVVHYNLTLSSWHTARNIALKTIENYILVQNIAQIYIELELIQRSLTVQFEMHYSVVNALNTYNELREKLVNETLIMTTNSISNIEKLQKNINTHLNGLEMKAHSQS